MANQGGGAADSYYNSGAPPPGDGYAMRQNPPYQPQYQKPPPNYDQNFRGGGAPPMGPGDKQTFDQKFKIDKPRYNDLWAGILVRLNRIPSAIGEICANG